ncbi:hypothetical protein Lfu02_40320 [Longispora fulva]|uniref:Transcriptional regulator with XRE-family HTH domain n=1 Tax=Longispora fulva TaxID=619741 RepID=A0A8J7GFC0_9ACTN|nr:trypsin-like peptidase domain-containing protein [Longispora fulva]MBG6136490.1 transcriptional regulator with XRE-family HTH domain [Longispora fulva]GIG59660.1 hypothetical protein Lfu02_40320 [Longispora fulva]
MIEIPYLVEIRGHAHGSGFLAAPGMVVTCAHVAGQAGSTVSVHWQGVVYTAVVAAASQPPAGGRGLWPFPDLAVLRVTGLPEDHPCGSINGRLPQHGSKLRFAGYTSVYDRVPRQMTGTCALAGSWNDGNGSFLRIGGDELSAGNSGGPVLDADTGVCAVAKSARTLDTDRGGLAVPIQALRHLDPLVYTELRRGHDLLHPTRRDPPGNLESSVGIPLDKQYELREICASLPETDAHRAHYNAAGGQLTPPIYPLTDYGDVISDLVELLPPVSGMPYLLSYAADLARMHPDVRKLQYWVLTIAARLGLEDEAVRRLEHDQRPRPDVSVMARLAPVGNSGRYHLRLWRYRDADTVEEVGPEYGPASLADVFQKLQAVLPEQLTRAEQHRAPVMVELIVPPELLDEEFDDWRIWPDEDWVSIGTRYAVVLRDLRRLENDRFRVSWERRWDAALAKDLGAILQFVGCAPITSRKSMAGWLEEDLSRSALVLPAGLRSSTSLVALDIALRGGVPVVLWSRGGCTGCADETLCVGARFYSGLRAALSAETMADLPERIKTLRNAADASQDPEHCGHGVALLWDDPRRRPPGQLLTRAEETVK